MKKTYVIDTNVFLDNPNIISSVQKNDIIIPYKVLEELDKHKYSPGLKGVNARDCSRIISNILKTATNNGDSLKTGIKLEHNKLYVRTHKEFIDTPELDDNNPDECIIKVALGCSKLKTIKNIVILSNDNLLRIKANSFGITCESYEENVEINSSKDLYSGHKFITVDETILDVFYQNKGKEKYFPISIKKLTKDKVFPNQFIILTNEKVDLKKKPYPLLKYDGQHLEYVSERKLSGGKVKALNLEQTMAIELLMNKDIPLVTLTGLAGSGKTLITLAAAMDQVVDHKVYQNIIVIRPMQAVGKEIGFLPGNLDEKLDPWLAPIKDNLRFILSDGHDNGKKSKQIDYNMKYLFDNGIIEMNAMTFIRGRSINNAFMIIDECQNISEHEIKTILTRVGKGTKIILNGDLNQIDRYDIDSITNGLSVVVEKFKHFGLSGHVTLNEGVRSDLAALAAEIL